MLALWRQGSVVMKWWIPSRVVVILTLVLTLVVIFDGTNVALAARIHRPKGIHTKAPTVTSTPVSALTPFNNEGISSDANPAVGNFDGGGRSYSSEALAAAGFAPGQQLSLGGIAFQWPTPAPGKPDNWLYRENTISFTTTSNQIAFLGASTVGASTVGASTGTGFVRFSDGTAQTFTITFSDWTLGGGSQQIDPSDTIAVTTPYRNTGAGRQTVNTYVFETIITVAPGKTIISVTLPRVVNQGGIHVFAIGAAPGTTNATIKGISNDTNLTDGNFDGGGRSYSNNALEATGLGEGELLNVYGFTVQWPTVAPAVHDTWASYGSVIPLSGQGNTLIVLGAAAGGASSGQVTITYADNSTQTATLALSDWTLGGGGARPLPGNLTVATMPYRNTATGPEQVATYVFAEMIGLVPGKTLKSLTMPSSETGGRLRVFAAAAGTSSAPFNVAGISSDATHTANFDGNGNSYSNNALATAGLASGASVAVHGLQFQWPTNAATSPDVWQASGQIIPMYNSGSTIGFLGAGANGWAAGTVTIKYTDGSNQLLMLTFSDWTLDGGASQPVPGESVAARMPYHNTSAGQQQVATYVFFTSVALASGKTLQSVTLPTSASGGGSLDIFAVSATPAVSPVANTWPTYLENPGRTSYDAAETTLTKTNAAQLTLKWTAHAQNVISSQPIFGNGLMYWSSWDGLLHASNPTTGADIWTHNIGQQTVALCDPPTAGPAAAATIGAIDGTPAVFVSGGNRTMYALNANTGAVIWADALTGSTDYYVWDAPALFNGSLYIGISSFGDCPLPWAKFYQLDLETGAIQNTFVLTPATAPGCTGDGVWGSPAVDVATGVVYFATGNGCTADPDSTAIIALSTGDLSLVDRWQVPPAQLVEDADFGNTPTLFTAVINGVTRRMVGVASKDGYYYALDRTNLSAGPIWEYQFAVGGDCPSCGDGSISPSAWDGATLYIAAGNTTINGVSCTSSVSAVAPGTGAFLWRRCLTTGATLGALVASPGLVVADSATTVYVFDATTGNTLFSYHDTSSSTFFYSAPEIHNGMLYAPNANGNLYAFGL